MHTHHNVVALIVLGLAACGGGHSPDPAAPGNHGGSAPDDAAAIAFVHEQIQACNAYSVQVGNSPAGTQAFDGGDADPTRTLTVTQHLGPDQYLLADADGDQLLVDLDTHAISAAGGQGQPLPLHYQFCQPDVFVGPAGD